MKIKTELDFPLVFLLLGAILSLGVAYDRSLSIPIFCSLIISWALYALLARLSPASARPVAWILLGLWTLGAWYFVSQYAHLGYPAKIGPIHKLGQFTGTLCPSLVLFRPRPNAMATFLEGGVPVGVALALSERSAYKRMAAIVAVLSLSYALLLTASRGAWVALICSAALAGLWRSGRRMRLRTRLAVVGGIGVLLAAAVGFMVAVGPERVRDVPGGLESAFSRFTLYTNSLNLVRDFAFTGIGLGGTFGLIYSRYVLLIRVPYLAYAHNMLLAVWLNHGLLGIFGFVWLLIVVVRLIGRGLRQGATPLFWGAAQGVVVSVLHGLTDATQYDGLGWTMVPLYALLGLMVATAPRQLVAKRRFRPSWPWMSLLGALCLILLGAMWPVLSSVYQINLGALAQASADLAPGLSEPGRAGLRDEAAMHYTRALQIWPSQTMSHRRLGLLALEAEDFDTAISHLEHANAGNPSHPANVKGLGYAYLWVGRLDQAEAYLQAVPNICDELKTWAWWRGTQGQHALAGYAQRLATRLCK